VEVGIAGGERDDVAARDGDPAARGGEELAGEAAGTMRGGQGVGHRPEGSDSR
jgi:hypothetical protein